ncbi:MAG TPA: hypothetical protein VN408_07330 [Actinoplanes sp.]|nr:hypothetical protein [Actinoplanes sp.]
MGPQSAFWKQQSWIISAMFFAVVLVVAAFAALVSAGEDQIPRGPAVVAGPLSAEAPRGPDGRPEGCRTNDGDVTVPTVSPRIEWRPIGAMRVPMSTTAGPLREDGPLLWCFARTPEGAVLAAQVIVAQMSTRDWRAVAGQQLVEGRASEFYAALHSDSEDAAGEPVTDFAGFTVPSFTPDLAVVKLLLNTAGASSVNVLTASYASTLVTVVWQGGDWKVLPTSAATISTSWETASGNNGFVLWRG